MVYRFQLRTDNSSEGVLRRPGPALHEMVVLGRAFAEVMHGSLRLFCL